MTVRQTLTVLAGDFAALLRTRFELLALEFAQERSRVFALLCLALGAFLFLLLGLLVLSVLVALLFWQSDYRYWSIGLLAGAYLLVAIALLLRLRWHLLYGKQPFEASLDVFSRDVERLRAAPRPDPRKDQAWQSSRREDLL